LNLNEVAETLTREGHVPRESLDHEETLADRRSFNKKSIMLKIDRKNTSDLSVDE
jgi:hypothetical protein